MDDTHGDNARRLRAIAAVLGVPVADLFAVPQPAPPTADEVAALVRAFRAVSDPMVRRACLEVLEAAAAPLREEPE